MQIGEIAKQGTVLGPTLCCVETDQINKIGESQERLLGSQKVAILIFVDDIMSAGTAEDARKAIRNMAVMEVEKKFTYGLKKTKYMVVDTTKGKAETIEEKVRSGAIKETDEYKYIGFWINKEGNCQLQIEKKMMKIKGEVVALRSIACYSNMGESFVNARLKMYEACIIPSLLYNMESWTKQSKKEIKQLEQIQASTLYKILELPKSTPYIALLGELGIWGIEERLMYRKLMFYNNLYNSDDRRLAKRIVVEQEENEDVEGSFFGTVKNMAESIDVPVEEVQTLSKSQLKKLLKTKLNGRMLQIIKSKAQQMTKMRFLKPLERFECKPYVTQLKGKESIEALRIRLNMIPVYGNYRGDLDMRRQCPHCEDNDDTTEHLLNCERFQSMVSSEHISNDNNIATWKQIVEVVTCNMEHRIDGPTMFKKTRTKKKKEAEKTNTVAVPGT